MDVNHDSGSEARQYLVIEKRHIASGLGRMRSVDEKHVPIPSAENISRSRFSTCEAMSSDIPSIPPAKKSGRIGLDAGEMHRSVEVLAIDPRRHKRRTAGSDLDHPARAKVTQDALEHPGIHAREHAVAAW